MNVSVLSRELFGDLSPKDTPPLLRKLRLGILIFYSTACLLIILTCTWLNIRDYDVVVNNTEQQSMALSQSLERHATRSLSLVENDMQALAGSIRQAGGSRQVTELWLHEHLKQKTLNMPQVRGLAIIDHEGRLIAHSNEYPAKKINLSDRIYFDYHRTHSENNSRIGEPLISRTDYKWLIPLTLRINDEQNKFDGLILAGIEPDYFLRFYNSLHLKRGVHLQIVRTDGILLLGYPLDIHRLGTSLKNLSTDGFSHVSALFPNSFNQYIAQTSSKTIPIRLRIISDSDHVLHRFNRDLIIRISVALLIMTVMTVMLALLLHQIRLIKKEDSRLRLTQFAVDVSPDMIVWCKRDGNLVYANQQLSIATGYSETELKESNVQKLIDLHEITWEQLFAETISGTRSLEAILRKKNHTQGVVELTVSTLTEANSSLQYIILRDISERHARQTELREHQKNLQDLITKQATEIQTVLNANPLAVMQIVGERITSVNLAFEKLFGYTKNSIDNLPESIIHASATRYLAHRKAVQIRVTKGGTYRGEAELRRSDGSAFWAQIHARELHTGRSSSGIVYIIEDISIRRAASQALKQSEQMKRTILDTTSDGFALLDMNRRFVDVNNALCLQNESTREFIIGKTAEDLWGTDLAGKFFPNSSLTSAPSVLEIELSAQGLQSRHLLVSRGLIKNTKNMAEYYFAFFTDISHQKSIEQSLKKAKDAAETANQVKNIFLTNISHELRTPMHAILSFAELGIQKTGTHKSSEVVRYFEQINQAGKHLLTLINDLIEMSCMTPNESKLKFGVHVLQQTIAATLSEISPQLNKKNLQLIHDDKTPSISAEYDGMSITQVVLNIMSNAIRFSPCGGKIHVQYLQPKAGDTQIAMVGFSIRDEGPGMSQGQIEHLNKMLKTGQSEVTSKTQSIGLTLCSQIVRGYEGTIYAANHAEGGTILTVLLPQKARSDRT